MKRIILTAILLAITLGIRAQSNATQVEYFLDTDNGFGLNTVLDITTPNTDITEAVLANIPGNTSTGYHKLYMRVKDTDGNWSPTIRKHIEIVPSYVENNIVMGEYFIDEDTEFGTATPFAIAPEEEDIEQAFSAQILETASIGYHKLYGRVKDAYGNWSHTFRKNIEVYKNPITDVVEVEYFFDNDLEFGNTTTVSITEPENDGSWTFNVPYSPGDYSFDDALFVRAKDSNGNWSITTLLDEIATLGINDHALTSSIVHPNPFKESIKISSSEDLSIKQVVVYNPLGKIVYNRETNSAILNLEFLSRGLYFLEIKTDTGEATFKIVKQ